MNTLVVANMAEFNESTRRGEFSPSERASWMRASDDLADMAALWTGSPKVLLVPRGIDHAWVDDIREEFRSEILVIESGDETGAVVRDALADPALLRRLADALCDDAIVVPWGVTGALLDLVSALRALGRSVGVAAPCRDALWSVSYLDGKVALNDLQHWIPELQVPRSHTALTYEQLLGLVAAMCRMGLPFVVKSNVGVGGYGTYLASEPTSFSAALRDLGDAMDREPVFREGPFLVQEHIDSEPSMLRPTYDGVVNADGTVENVGVGGMLINGAEYRGVVVGDVPLSKVTIGRAQAIGRRIGNAASSLGFRGWFDVDFVVRDDGELFATEINARRTSPTHAFAALASWQARDPRIRCVLADDHVPVATAGLTWRDIANVFDEARSTGMRCAAAIVRSLAAERPALGVVVGAASFEHAVEARDELAMKLGDTSTVAAIAR